MSFFISESLKGIITEKDLQANSPIKIVEEETLLIHLYNDDTEGFEFELLAINFCEVVDEIKMVTDKEKLSKIIECVNKKVKYSILLNGTRYLENSGKLVLNKLEVNKEDNYVLCKIDIFKRSH